MGLEDFKEAIAAEFQATPRDHASFVEARERLTDLMIPLIEAWFDDEVERDTPSTALVAACVTVMVDTIAVMYAQGTILDDTTASSDPVFAENVKQNVIVKLKNLRALPIFTEETP